MPSVSGRWFRVGFGPIESDLRRFEHVASVQSDGEMVAAASPISNQHAFSGSLHVV